MCCSRGRNPFQLFYFGIFHLVRFGSVSTFIFTNSRSRQTVMIDAPLHTSPHRRTVLYPFQFAFSLSFASFTSSSSLLLGVFTCVVVFFLPFDIISASWYHGAFIWNVTLLFFYPYLPFNSENCIVLYFPYPSGFFVRLFLALFSVAQVCALQSFIYSILSYSISFAFIFEQLNFRLSWRAHADTTVQDNENKRWK